VSNVNIFYSSLINVLDDIDIVRRIVFTAIKILKMMALSYMKLAFLIICKHVHQKHVTYNIL